MWWPSSLCPIRQCPAGLHSSSPLLPQSAHSGPVAAHNLPAIRNTCFGGLQGFGMRSAWQMTPHPKTRARQLNEYIRNFITEAEALLPNYISAASHMRHDDDTA